MRIFVLGALALMLAGCGGGGDSGPSLHSVSYSIGGIATSATITYATPGGGTSQQTVSIPYTVTGSFADGEFLYISAQNQTSLGTISVAIDADGHGLGFNISSGAYAIATASKTCC